MEIAVISGKGGTGKSSITAAFVSIAQSLVLADCDVDAANQYILFRPVNDEEQVFVSSHKAVINPELCRQCGKCIKYCRFDAISKENGIVKIKDTSCDGCRLCSRICPAQAIDMIPEDKSRMYAGVFRYGHMVYGRLSPGEENSGRLVDMVRQKAKEIAKTELLDNIVIDGPPGIGCPVISSITGVDQVVLVTEPTRSGVHDMKRALEICSGFKLKTHLIINKYDLNETISAEIEDYCESNQISLLGKLPFDPKMVEAMVNCQSIIEYDPDGQSSRILREYYSRIF